MFVVILVLPLMFMLNWWLTLLLFVMPLISLTVKFSASRSQPLRKIQDFFGQITARAQENFSGVRVVRAYAQEDAEMAAFNNLNWQYGAQSRPRARRGVDAAVDDVPDRVGYVLIIWAGARSRCVERSRSASLRCSISTSRG